MTSSFDFAPLFPAGLPAPSARWTGLAKYSFVGGNNDSEQVPLDELIGAAMQQLVLEVVLHDDDERRPGHLRTDRDARQPQ